MTKWFVVGTESMTAEEEKSFIRYVQSKGLGWWHWIPDFWPITGDVADLECSEIRDELSRIGRGNSTLVLEIQPVTWSGFGPKNDKRNMFTWLRRTWRARDAEV
jgi:hypothetical protein